MRAVRNGCFEMRLELSTIDSAEIKRNLRSWFSQFAPGYKYDNRFRRHVWDGKICFYSGRDSSMPVGLLGELEKFCLAMDYSLEIDPALRPNGFEGLSPEEIKEFVMSFVEALNLPADKQPRPYQLAYFAKFAKDFVVLAESPTATGKSLIIYMCMRYALAALPADKKALIIVPTVQLVEQMFKDFAEYGFDSDREVATIYASGRDRLLKLKTEKRVIISTWQSLVKVHASDFDCVGVVFGDEIHEFGAQKSKGVLTSCKNASMRLGTTGTLKNSDLYSKWTVQGMFAEPTKYITTMEAVDRGYISHFVIRVVNMIYDEISCKTAKNLSYQEEMDYLSLREDRMHFLVKLAVQLSSSKKNSLFLFKTLDFGKRLVDSMVSVGLRVKYVDGSVAMSDRENVRTDMEIGEGVIAVCSFGTFSRGINIKKLHNIVFAQPLKTEIRLLQSIGRSLRNHETKDMAVVLDLVDNLKHGKRENYALKHFEERNSIYKHNGFKVSYADVEMF